MANSRPVLAWNPVGVDTANKANYLTNRKTMKDQNNKILTGIKALSLASLIAVLAGCEAEKVKDGEMPSVDINAEGGELPSVTVDEGELPDIDVDADPGSLPEYDIDSKLEIGSRQETITVPEVRWKDDNIEDAEATTTSDVDVAVETREPTPSATQPPPHQQELFVEQQEMEVLTQQDGNMSQQTVPEESQAPQTTSGDLAQQSGQQQDQYAQPGEQGQQVDEQEDEYQSSDGLVTNP